MSKKFLGILIFCLFINFVSSLELGLSPAYINLEITLNEKVCTNISLHSDKEVIVQVKNLWAEKRSSREIKDYTLESSELKIGVFSTESIKILGKDNLEICFTGENPGDYYGAILFESKNGYASIGSWINLKITKQSRITGNFILENSEEKIFVIALIPEIIILFILIKFLKKKKQKLV